MAKFQWILDIAQKRQAGSTWETACAPYAIRVLPTQLKDLISCLSGLDGFAGFQEHLSEILLPLLVRWAQYRYLANDPMPDKDPGNGPSVLTTGQECLTYPLERHTDHLEKARPLRLDKLTLLFMVAIQSARLLSAHDFIIDGLTSLTGGRIYAMLQRWRLASLD